MNSLRLAAILLLLASPLAQAENLVRNGDFASDVSLWNLRLAPDAQATLVHNDGAASVLVIAGGSSRWTVNLEQLLAAPLRQGVTYTVAFDLRSDSPRAIDAVIRSRSGGILGSSYRIPADPQIRREQFTYTHKEADTEARIAFRLGGEATAVSIDNVVIEPVPATPAPPPPAAAPHSPNPPTP